MIDLIARTIKLDKGEGPIIMFVVWWATPFGLMPTLDEAINRCMASDMDPNEVIRALPVAVTESTYEVLK